MKHANGTWWLIAVHDNCQRLVHFHATFRVHWSRNSARKAACYAFMPWNDYHRCFNANWEVVPCIIEFLRLGWNSAGLSHPYPQYFVDALLHYSLLHIILLIAQCSPNSNTNLFNFILHASTQCFDHRLKLSYCLDCSSHMTNLVSRVLAPRLDTWHV